MQALTLAIQREQWDAVSVLLLSALVKVTNQVPRDAVQGLLEALEVRGSEGDMHGSQV
ncbi:MAG: hypothetical protein HY666_01080 [Chloroflexi bacterium]|nr:hypothetical protein [Chloroflexota bacterium]